MATIHHSGINIIEAISFKANVKIRYKTLGWADEYFYDAATSRAELLRDCPRVLPTIRSNRVQFSNNLPLATVPKD